MRPFANDMWRRQKYEKVEMIPHDTPAQQLESGKPCRATHDLK